jgi:cytochrome c5
MSNTQQEHTEHTEEHGTLIKTPKQLIVTIVLSFVVPILIILLLVNLVASGDQVGAGSDALSPEATAKRIAPVAKLELVDASGPKVFKTGEQVYAAVCAGCHKAGLAGAPKVGDAGAWTPLLARGQESLVTNAIKGIRGMPAKGGNPALDDYEVARAVVYMTNQSGGKFEEPAAPAPAAAAK